MTAVAGHPAKSSNRGKIMVATALLVVVAGGLFYAIAMPRGAQLYNLTTQAPLGSHQMSETATIHNPNADERITGVSSTAAGIQLTGVTTQVNGVNVSLWPNSSGLTFRHGSVVKISLSFQVTDCSARMTYPPPVSVHLSRFGLVHTVTLQDYGFDFPLLDNACRT